MSAGAASVNLRLAPMMTRLTGKAVALDGWSEAIIASQVALS